MSSASSLLSPFTNLLSPLAAGAVAVLLPLALAVPQRGPTFRSRTDLVLIDVQVTTDRGAPVLDLGLRDFDVSLDGQQRNVVAVTLIRHDQPGLAGQEGPRAMPEPAAAASEYHDRRMFVLAIDETSFSAGAVQAWRQAIAAFVAGIRPPDLVGLYAYPAGGPIVPLTDDPVQILDGVSRVVGRLDRPILIYKMSLSEMVDITAGDPEALDRVARRECSSTRFNFCRNVEIPREALAYAQQAEMSVSQSIGGLRALMRSLRDLPGRKVVVVVSGGLPAADRIGGRLDVNQLLWEVGREAAEASIVLYVLHLDSSFVDAFASGTAQTAFRDSDLLGLGLDRFSGVAGGELIRVHAGSGDIAFARILRATSAYYLLAVRPEDGERDGRPHRVETRVRRRGLSVQGKAWVVVPRANSSGPQRTR